MFQVLIAAFGRVCLSLIFILVALNKILDWQGAEQHLLNALSDWIRYTQGIDWAQRFFETLFSRASLLLLVGSLMELIGGLLVLFGMRLRFAALVLLLVLAPYTAIYHYFWFLEGSARDLQMSMFLQNLSIFGGLLLLLAYGGGKGKSSENA